jgi:hypothetical protein
MRGTGHFASRSHHPQRLWLWFCPRLACPADLRCIPYVFKAAPGTFLSAGQKKRSGDYEPLARERVQQEITRVSAGRGLANADVPRPVIPPGSGNVNCKRHRPHLLLETDNTNDQMPTLLSCWADCACAQDPPQIVVAVVVNCLR